MRVVSSSNASSSPSDEYLGFGDGNTLKIHVPGANRAYQDDKKRKETLVGKAVLMSTKNVEPAFVPKVGCMGRAASCCMPRVV